MKYNKVNLIYFSATNTTKTVMEYIAQGLGIDNIVSYNITKGQAEEISFNENDIVVFGMPVYSGRIPQLTIEYLNKFKGNKTPAIIACVYGNRDYDDALLELKDIVTTNNFTIISAGAFIGQHSIFPATGNNRPDDNDKKDVIAFGHSSMEMLKNNTEISTIPEISVKGNFPYKEIKPVPLKPEGNRHCDNCGKCVRECPAHAIDINHPRKTDKLLCISCARCIYVCPQKARSFRGLLYMLVSKKFNKAYSVRKESEVYFADRT